MHRRVDAIRPGHEVERWHQEAHPSRPIQPAGEQAFQVGVRSIHAGSVGVIDADAEDEVILRHAHVDIHLDDHRASRSESD
ncbi:MAG: hypothetical protein DMF57_08880 [Acidobacteria bacterium]|nr:MAG: hypothetical protein DMF57_08880 [Acidobacteriota bacterium]